MYATMERVNGIELNGANQVELKGQTDTIVLESKSYNTDELIKELIGTSMDALYKWYRKQGFTDKMATNLLIETLEKELCDNYGSYEVIGG